ncbi:unnamed protein product [Dibothriocephalus latus]|uniref:RING-type E3 ubiquitin transferase n=1 Tax=Dibothriocephalus latus TaxID=60516 RepID=A0A3P7P3M8_DIBLA|nr:unnamed protein product [Dibothriocephalus latus]
MPLLSEAIWEALQCSVCLEICKEPYRLPCEDFFCKEPCLQGLLNSARPTCPVCRLPFSRVDVERFRTPNDIIDLIQKPTQTNQMVQAPLQRSEHCWNTGEVIHESVVREPIPI